MENKSTLYPEHKTGHKCHILKTLYQGGYAQPILRASTKNTNTPTAL